jgi:hypothetical protein
MCSDVKIFAGKGQLAAVDHDVFEDIGMFAVDSLARM